MEILFFIFLVVVISGISGEISRRYEVHVKKKKAYLSIKKDKFFTWKVISIKGLSYSVIGLFIWLGFIALFDVKMELSSFWKIYFLLSCVAYYFIYEQFGYLFKKLSTIFKWLWLGGSAVSSVVSSFWISERVSSITRLPQGELAASDLLLSFLQFFVVLIFIFMILNYIPVLVYYVRLLFGFDLNARGVATVACLLFITTLGPVMYFKTTGTDGFQAFFKDAIVYSSYSPADDRCIEVKGLDVHIAFIKNGMISIAEYVPIEDSEYMDVIFSKDTCTINI